MSDEESREAPTAIFPGADVDIDQLLQRIHRVRDSLQGTADHFWSLHRPTLPAARSAVSALETTTLGPPSRRLSTPLTCVICIEDVSLGSEVTVMPCSHGFHGGCILAWLQRNHTCPVCRFELPTRDLDEL